VALSMHPLVLDARPEWLAATPSWLLAAPGARRRDLSKPSPHSAAFEPSGSMAIAPDALGAGHWHTTHLEPALPPASLRRVSKLCNLTPVRGVRSDEPRNLRRLYSGTWSPIQSPRA